MKFLLRFTTLPEGTLEAAERLEQLRALEYGYRIKVLETDLNSIEVDVPEDIRKVEKTVRIYD
jgi:3-deoxy-manno-octulosonate cytidylyltransferase (CMP-KDO synthetase)